MSRRTHRHRRRSRRSNLGQKYRPPSGRQPRCRRREPRRQFEWRCPASNRTGSRSRPALALFSLPRSCALTSERPSPGVRPLRSPQKVVTHRFGKLLVALFFRSRSDRVLETPSLQNGEYAGNHKNRWPASHGGIANPGPVPGDHGVAGPDRFHADRTHQEWVLKMLPPPRGDLSARQGNRRVRRGCSSFGRA
jgi:hypothetical protein